MRSNKTEKRSKKKEERERDTEMVLNSPVVVWVANVSANLCQYVACNPERLSSHQVLYLIFCFPFQSLRRLSLCLSSVLCFPFLFSSSSDEDDDADSDDSDLSSYTNNSNHSHSDWIQSCNFWRLIASDMFMHSNQFYGFNFALFFLSLCDLFLFLLIGFRVW